MLQNITKRKIWILLFIPGIFLGILVREHQGIPSLNLSPYFPRENLQNKENMLRFTLLSLPEVGISLREKKRLATTLVRLSHRLQLPDGYRIGERPAQPELFLLSWAMSRTQMGSRKTKGRGILGMLETQFLEAERKFGYSIERKFDAENFTIQYKLALLLYKDYLALGQSPEEAYHSLFGDSTSEEWKSLVSFYQKIYDQNYSSLP